MKTSQKLLGRQARKRRTRAVIRGTAARPRLSVHRSLLHIRAQLINDENGTTIATASTAELKAKPNLEGAKKLGEAIAKKAKTAKIETVVFDRNGYRYHGRIQAVADAAREAGLSF